MFLFDFFTLCIISITCIWQQRATLYLCQRLNCHPLAKTQAHHELRTWSVFITHTSFILYMAVALCCLQGRWHLQWPGLAERHVSVHPWRQVSCLPDSPVLLWRQVSCLPDSPVLLWRQVSCLPDSPVLLWRQTSCLPDSPVLLWRQTSCLPHSPVLLWRQVSCLPHSPVLLWRQVSCLPDSPVLLWRQTSCLPHSPVLLWRQTSCLPHSPLLRPPCPRVTVHLIGKTPTTFSVSLEWRCLCVYIYMYI